MNPTTYPPAIGTVLRLTGKSWVTDYGAQPNQLATVDDINDGVPWSNQFGSLGTREGFYGTVAPYDYAVEVVPAEVDPAEALFQVLEDFARVVSAISGMVKQLEAEGFTEEQARGIVAAIFSNSLNGGAK